MIKTLFKNIGGEVTRIHAHDYECAKLETDGFVYSAEEAAKVKQNESGNGNKKSAAKDTGTSARVTT